MTQRLRTTPRRVYLIEVLEPGSRHWLPMLASAEKYRAVANGRARDMRILEPTDGSRYRVKKYVPESEEP